jgi:hypothetical protein
LTGDSVTGTVIGSQGPWSELTGGLVGGAFGTTISDSYSGATVSGYGTVGGLVGVLAASSAINNSYSIGSVTSLDVEGGWGVGGLVGLAGGTSTISNSYSRASVINSGSALDYAGGFIGYADAITVNNSYSVGSVTGIGYLGGFVGYSDSLINYNSSYWDVDVSGLTSGIGAGGATTVPIGKTTADMKTMSTYVGWDFSNIWVINTSVDPSGYPYFGVTPVIPPVIPPVVPPVVPTPLEEPLVVPDLTPYVIIESGSTTGDVTTTAAVNYDINNFAPQDVGVSGASADALFSVCNVNVECEVSD